MRIATLVVAADQTDSVIAELYGLGTEGIQEISVPGRGVRLEAWFRDKVDLGWLERYQPLWTDAPDADWSEQWREAWEPLLVGQRLYVAPEWRDDPTPPGRVRLVIRPAQASGTGYHPPTRLALEALEVVVEPGTALLDVGTGSGILCRAALLLGARLTIGCDIDARCLDEARDLTVFVGSARAVRTALFDCVVANLNAEALLALREDLCRVVRPGGWLVLGGFKARRLGELRAAFNWPVARELQSAEWRCLILQSAARQESK